MERIILIYVIVKIVMMGISGLVLSSTRKNIMTHIEAIKQKPTSRKRTRITEINMRLKLTKMFTPLVLIPGIGEVIFIATTLGRFSNKAKIEQVYEKTVGKIDNNNLADALDKLGEPKLTVYKTLKRETGYLSVQGHSEIARQSVITLNSLLVDASIAGINLKKEPAIEEALHDTAELVAALLREEQSGIQSNIDTYRNVVDSIKSDLLGKKSVFMETTSSEKDGNV